ncbi:MAG: hypothetical protein HN542_00300 [Flavobacteriales bacterium]|nr:hypothetical protein [Flavobacteriales bacterium]NCG29940.1 hypothetical protein [Bacteroidota bacterium]MBT3963366.1 hypothetical protein [Flavobacteriales bacterium]MBT4704490.1 hypothetical protein [Flavobacteriales bacterium]MBT4931245.1 hypothetical protein [Flavobacteriales bacterium]
MKSKWTLALTLPFLIGFISCNKCKTCYLVDESNDRRIETELGLFCGEKLIEDVSVDFLASNGGEHVYCR